MPRDPFQVTPGGSGEYEPVPAGQHFAGLAAALFMPNRPGYMGGPPQNELQLIWIIPALLDNKGQRKQVRGFVKWPDNPLHENAGFRKFLYAWTGGQQLTDEQKANFNLRQVIGGRAIITTEVATSQQNRQYAKLIGPGPVPADAPPIDYTGTVIKVQPYPDMVSVAAPGVQVVESQQQQRQPQQADPRPRDAAGNLVPVGATAAAGQPAQPVYATAGCRGSTAPERRHTPEAPVRRWPWTKKTYRSEEAETRSESGTGMTTDTTLTTRRTRSVTTGTTDRSEGGTREPRRQ